MLSPNVRAVIDEYMMVQKSRIAWGNRVKAIESGRDEADNATLQRATRYYERYMAFEEEIQEDVVLLTKGEEIIERMVAVKGVGYLLAAKVACHIDIELAEHASSLWKYAGMAVMDDGRADRPVRGQKLGYNKRLKASVVLVGFSMIKQRNSPYRAEYDAARVYYEANRPDWRKARQHMASLRKMEKLWLAHLWYVWRSIEGLETTQPYAIEKLGHTHVKTYLDYGWEPL